MTPTELHYVSSVLKGLTYQGLVLWLEQNFTPARFRAGNEDVVEMACNMLFTVYNPHDEASHAVRTIEKLWAEFGELPEVKYNIDSYGRLTTVVPNYDKPGVRERTRELAEVVEPSQDMLERWGRG